MMYRIHLCSDKQRLEKLGYALDRLRTNVALPIYQQMSDHALFMEEKQVKLRDVTKKIEKMEQRMFDLDHFYLVGTTLDKREEVKVLELLDDDIVDNGEEVKVLELFDDDGDDDKDFDEDSFS